ncbi:MAG: hypothetical protein KG003_11540 [Bacteroidetes bacterium]|nr:hypothetical protein [Bacteroidota bacterium]
MFRYKISHFCIALVLFGCQSSTQENKKDSTEAAPVKTEAPAETREAVAETENSLITESHRKKTILFGKYVEVSVADFHPVVSETVIHMNLLMSNGKVVAIGPLTFAYPAFPASGKQKIFIGQPVAKVFAVEEGFGFIELPETDYYKYQCNAETGNTFTHHQKAREILNEKKLAIKLPVLEIFSETRNNEMTVVSKATLLYPKK